MDDPILRFADNSINSLVNQCHQTSTEHGFWDDLPVDDVMVVLAKLMLVVTEVAECAEALRDGDKYGIAEELADICIRVFDLSGAIGVDLGEAITTKMDKNKNRPRMHGKLA